MLAISEFKQIYLRLPEINQENDQINLSNLAKKHLNELISKDVCVIFSVHKIYFNIILILAFD